jgi:hypothetical protein
MTSAVPQLEEHLTTLGPKRRQPTSRAKFLDEKNGNYADETSKSQEVSTPSNYPLPWRLQQDQKANATIL